MNIVPVSIVCLVIAVICRLLAKESGEFSAALSICTVIIICAVIIYAATDVLALAKRLYDRSLASERYFNIMIKGAGICIITRLTSDSCRDCGETSLASACEMAGRLALLITTFPLFNSVLSLIEELII